MLTAGEWHAVSYEVYRSSLDLPQLDLFVGDQQVAILGSQSDLDPDEDGDGVPSSYELSDSASLTWRKDSLLQLTVPCDRTAGEDVQIKIQVVRGTSDPDPDKLLEWHTAEEAGRQVRLTQVMIAYGPGSNAPSRGQVDYWNNLEDLTRFLNATNPWPVDTYNLIGKDANGFSNTSALMGDCDPLPQSGTAAYDYQMILFPSLAERVAEYTLRYPSDHPAIQNDGTVVLRLRAAIAAVDQSRTDPNDLSLLGLYDYPSNLTLSGAEVSFISDVNGLLGEPRDAETHIASWSYNMNPNIQMDWNPEIERAIVASFTGAHFMTQYNWNEFDNTTLSAMERLNYARNQTPWDGQSAEVTYITQTTRTLDLLSKINQSVYFDLTTGEQYCRYPKMYDFASMGAGQYLNPGFSLIPGWTCTAGMGDAKILRNVQTRAGVLELRPDSGSLTVYGDKGIANGTGHVSFAAYLDSIASSLEIRIGNGSTPDSFALVVEGGFLKYRAADGSLLSLTEFWPREWFECTLDFDNFDGIFDLFIDGALQFAAINLPAWHPWNEIQTMDVIVANGKSTLDSLGLYWGDPDPSEFATQVCYESVHYGDVADRVSFYEVSDVYNGTYVVGDPELAGGELDLYSTYYTNLQHAMQRVKVQNWPLSLRLVHAGDTSMDDFHVDNLLNLTIAQGTFLPATWVPNSPSSPFSWSGRDAPDTVTFRNLVVNEWANPPLAGVPATITLTLGDDAHWEWDWRAGEVDPWAEFHARHTLPIGEIDVQAELAKRIQIIDEAVDYASKLIAKILKGEIPEFEVVEYIEAPGGRSVVNPSTLEQINVGGFGAIPAGDAMYFVRTTFTRDDLLEACGEIIVAYNKLLEIIYAKEGTKLFLPRWVRINPQKLQTMYHELYEQYFDQRTHKLGRIPQEIVDQLHQDVLIIEDANYGKVTFEQYYAREVWVTVTQADKIKAIKNAKRSCDLFHPRQVKGKKIMIDYAAKFLGIDPSDPVLGDPEQKRTFGGVEVTLPSVKPTSAERKRGYIYTSFGKLMGTKDPFTFTTPEGKDMPFDVQLLYFLESSPYYTGKWTAAFPFTYYDPQNLAAAMFFDSERFGGKLFYNFDIKIRDKFKKAYEQTGDPVKRQALKTEYEQALEICQILGYGSKTRITFGHEDEDNVLTDMGYLVNRNAWPLDPLAPQVKPGKIFQYGGELTYVTSIHSAKKGAFHVYRWQQYTSTGLGRATTIQLPTVFRVPFDWETGEIRDYEKLFETYSPSGKELQSLLESARKAQKNWLTCFNEADSILKHFMELLHNITRWGGQTQPGILIKLACVAKNLIPLLEKTLPKGPIRNSWIRSKGYSARNLPALIEQVFSEFTGIGRGQVHKLLNLKKIFPTPFHDEREFVQFDLWAEIGQESDQWAKTHPTGEYTKEEGDAILEQQETGRIPGRVPGSPLPIPPAVQKILNEKFERLRRLWNAYLDYLEQNETRPQNPPSTSPSSRPPVTPAAPGALGALDYFQRVGSALLFDAFIGTFFGETAGFAPGTPLQVVADVISQSPVPQTATVPIQVAGGNQFLLMAAAGGGSPAPVVSYTPEGYAYTPTYPITTPEGYAAMPVYPNKSPWGGSYSPVPSSQRSYRAWGSNAQNRYQWDPEGTRIVDATQMDAAPVRSEISNEIDAMDLPSQAEPNLAAMSRMITITKIAIVISVISYVAQTWHLIEDYEHGAPVANIVLDWVSMGITAVQIGIAIETLALLSETYAITTITTCSVALSDVSLSISAGMLSALSTVTLIFSVVLAFVSYQLFSAEAKEQAMAPLLTRLDPSVVTRLNFPAASNASIIRNGALHPGDAITLQTTVSNNGYMGWERKLQYEEYDWFGDTTPKVSAGAPFWYRFRARAGPAGGLGNWPENWAGPWAGDPVDWDKWNSKFQDFDTEDLVFPNMDMLRTFGDPVKFKWSSHYLRSAPKHYTYDITIPVATSSVIIQLENEFDTTDNGRSHLTEKPLVNSIVVGDSNGDGYIDPLFGEEALPVLESTLDGFIAACQNVTSPTTTLDEVWANFTTSVMGYQWRDAENYLTQLLAQASATTVLPEGQFNATVARLVSLMGIWANQTWRTFEMDGFQSDPLPASVVDNYYLLQTSGLDEWNALLNGDQGVALLDAGWRAARPLYPVDGNFYTEDFTYVGEFPEDWERSSTTIHVDWRDSELEDQRVLRFEENHSTLFKYEPQEAHKDFGVPLLGGRVCVSLEYATLTQPVYFGPVTVAPLWLEGGDGVFKLEYDPTGQGARIYYGDGDPIIDFVLPPFAVATFVIDFDIVAGTITLTLGPESATLGLPHSVINTFWIGAGYSGGPDDINLWISDISLSNRDEQDAQLNGYGLTSPLGLILVPKTWNITMRQAFHILKSYPQFLAQIPCKTNINATYSWGTATPILEAGGTFTGSIDFIYQGADNPSIDFEFIAPAGWDIEYDSKQVPLKSLLRVPFMLEAPHNAPAGTYYLDFVEQRADGSSLAGNVTFACRIPIRVRYNATWELEVAGLSDTIWPDSSIFWATLFNRGTSPQSVYITGDGVPLDWLTVDGYTSIARWDFNGGTGGWAFAGGSTSSYLDDSYCLVSNYQAVDSAAPDWPFVSGLRAIDQPVDFYPFHQTMHTYFTVPEVSVTYAEPVGLIMQATLYQVSAAPGTMLVVAPANGPVPETWNEAPGFDAADRVWQAEVNTLPLDQPVLIGSLEAGVTYALFLDDGQGSVWMYDSPRVQYVYEKITATSEDLVLQSDTSEVVSAMKNISALIQPGDRIRITYENLGASDVTLGAWDSFALLGNGLQERVFIAEGFYTLANLTVSARVGPGQKFRVDHISLERSLTRNAPLAEFAFAGETATPAMYGWAVSFGSGASTISYAVPVTNAAFVDRDSPNVNFDASNQPMGTELYVGYGYPYQYISFLEIPGLPAPASVYSTFGAANHSLLVADTDLASIRAYPCDAFNETTVTWATRPSMQEDLGIDGTAWALGYSYFWAWDVTDFPSDYVCLNATAPGWWVFPSDEGPAAYRPQALYAIPKWGVTGGTLVVQSDQDETFHLSRALNGTQGVLLQAGDKVWVSFETTSAGGATLVLANADLLGADLSFPLAAAADQDRGIIYREFIIPTSGTYTALAIDGTLGSGQNFSLAFAGVYHYQPYGTPLASASIGGFYNENILPTNLTQFTPLTGGIFSFDGSKDGFTGVDVSTTNGSLTLAPTATSVVTATCALAELTLPSKARARARYNSTAPAGSYIKFVTSAGDLVWVLPISSGDSWQETTFLFPQCTINAIIIGGSFTASTNLSLDYLLLEAPAAAPCVLPEVAGRRDVVALKNILACGGVINYSFPEPQSQGRLDFSIYAPGTNATLAITLEGTGGAGISITIADWQLWLGNLSGAFAAAGIYGGWHSLSIAWDSTTHNYTVWYFNQTLVEANYTAGWGILNFTGAAITGVRIGTADAKSAYYLDCVYFDPAPAWPSNLSLVETFQPGAGIYVDLRPGEEWTLQLAAPPRSPLTAPGTYPVHLAIYDASTGQLIGLVHKNITIPAFYDIGLECDAPSQVILDDGWVQGDFIFSGTLANMGNVQQTFTLSAPGIALGVTAAFLVDAGGTWEPAGAITLAPGASKAYRLEIQDAPRIACTFAIEAMSANNVTSLPVSFVFSGWPSYESTIDPIEIEWQPAGVDLMFTAWDNTTLDPWFEAWMGPVYLGTGTWESGVPFNVSLDPLLARGAEYLGWEMMVFVYLRDGYFPAEYYANPMHVIVILDDVLSATITPPDVVTTWETSLEPITWILVDNGAWDSTTSWQDDFGDGTLGPQWIPAGVTEYNSTLRLPAPALDPMGTQLLALAPAAEDFAVVTRIAYAPFPSNICGGPGIVIPTDDEYHYIKWQTQRNDATGTSWYFVETLPGLGGTTHYGPVAGHVTNLAVVVHGAGPAATYDLWYCLDDTAWTRVVAGHTAVSYGTPAQRRFGLCTGPYDVDAEFDWVRCQTLRAAPGATYTISMDGTVVQSGGWAGFSTVSLSLDDLRPLGPALIGLHEFTLILNDPVGGITSSTVNIDITQVSPVLSQPSDYSGVEGDTPTITWDVMDNYAVNPTYTVFLGPLGASGIPISSGTWVSGGAITVTLPALTPGTFACRVVATNDLGGVSEDQVILTIVQAALVPALDVTSMELPASADQEMVWTTPALTLDVTLTTTAEVTLVAGAWDSNPVVGVPPELAAEGAYFSLAASNEAAIQFPVTLTVTFPYNYAYGWSEVDLAQWVGAYVYNEVLGVWELADCSVLDVLCYGTLEGIYINVTLTVPHFSIFAVGLLNLPPVLSSPANIAYLGGSMGHAIAWQVTDNTTSDPAYSLTRDGDVVSSGNWPLDNLITLNVDGLAPGAHNFTLVVDDGRYGTASDSVLVVVDNFAPTVSAPLDTIYTWGTTGNAITWYLTDDTIQGPTYTLTRDGELVGSGAWPLSNIITLNVDGLAVGTSLYHLEILDGLTGTASDEVRVTVLNTASSLSSPPDVSYEYGTLAPTIAWTVADGTVLAGTYTVTLGGFPVAQGAWASGDAITWTPDDLLPGTWAATLTVADGYGGVTSDSLAITVTNAPPVITGQHSAVFEAGNASAGVWVTITDLSTASDAAFSIYRNGTRVASGRWASGSNIFVDLRFTPPGRNNLEIVAWDGLGGVATHSLLATTTNMAPVVVAPLPVTFEAGTATPLLYWTITDESAENATYAIAVNGMTVANSTWVSGDVISLAAGSWLPGTYNVTLAAADGWGAVVENGTLVKVTNAAPVVLAAPAISYEAGDPRPVAAFVVTDASYLDPAFIAYLDGSPIANGTWSPGIPVTIPAGGFEAGSHVLTLVVEDGYGAVGTGEVSITVWPDDDTTCDLANLTCAATPFNVTFTCDLVDPAGYASLDWVALNGTLIPLGNLSLSLNGTRVTASFNYTFAASGTYVLRLQLTDGDNDWPGDGAVGVFTCSFEVALEDPVESLLGAAITQLGTFITTARGIDEWLWRVLIVACGTRARSAAATALEYYRVGLVSKAEVRAKAAQALVCVADILVQNGGRITGGSDPVWGDLHAQAGAIEACLSSAISLLKAS